MTLFKLNSSRTILIEEDCEKNSVPLILELVQNVKHILLYVLNFEQPIWVWKKVFNSLLQNTNECIEGNKYFYEQYHSKSLWFIDSINQMILTLGWSKCLNYIRQLQNDQNVLKIIIVLHRDCLLPTSKVQANLNHLSNATITYDHNNCRKVFIQIKKGGKFTKTEEILTYDNVTNTLTLKPETKVEIKTEERPIVSPNSLTTFKIETDQTQQLEKYKLQLPYMSKINEGQGKVYYEPDAVDDWDEEDPDDDLEI